MAFDPVSLGLLGGGALAGGLSSLFSRSPKPKQVSRLSPQQLALQNQLGGLGMEQLKNPYAGFEPIAQQARQQFTERGIPSLAERFTAMGSGGQRSSAFPAALGQAQSGLESSLAALQSQYGLENKRFGAGLLNQALQPQFDTVFRQPQGGFSDFLSSTLGGLSGPLGQMGTLGLYQGMQPNAMDKVSSLLENPKFSELLNNPKFLSLLKLLGVS